MKTHKRYLGLTHLDSTIIDTNFGVIHDSFHQE